MSEVLSGDVKGHFDVKFEFHHFKGCGMPVAKQVAEESSVSS
jgi:ribosomal protein S13